MSRQRGEDCMVFFSTKQKMSQAWKKIEYQLLPKQVYLWGRIRRKGLCAPVLALAVWQVAEYLLQLQNPKFL